MYFNSRPREEVDKQAVACTICFDISTHDLTRRSTITTQQQLPGPIFQLTTSRGGRLAISERLIPSCAISTHDLTRRSTNRRGMIRYTRTISTHDLTKRSTRTPMHILSFLNAFQLTTSRRGRHSMLYKLAYKAVFQLTTSRRGRH